MINAVDMNTRTNTGDKAKRSADEMRKVVKSVFLE